MSDPSRMMGDDTSDGDREAGMAGFGDMYVVGTPGGFAGADGANRIDMLVLVGHAGRMWLEPRYFDTRLGKGWGVTKVVPNGPDDPNMLLDALLAFAPALFTDCPSFGEVAAQLEGTERLDFDAAPEAIPAEWPQLREEARETVARLNVWRARLEPVEM